LRFRDGMARDKDLGVPEEKYAFARVASFLFPGRHCGRSGGDAALGRAAGADPGTKMVAGATLERAGDARARDRYRHGRRSSTPICFIAQVGQAPRHGHPGATRRRPCAWPGRCARPRRTAPSRWRSWHWPGGAIPIASRCRSRRRSTRSPTAQPIFRRDSPSLPHAIAALRAFDKHDADEARAEILKGLAVADSPGAAVWLGTIALPLGDEALARKGALGALQLSAVYEPARALAARVALLGGRLDEALKGRKTSTRRRRTWRWCAPQRPTSRGRRRRRGTRARRLCLPRSAGSPSWPRWSERRTR